MLLSGRYNKEYILMKKILLLFFLFLPLNALAEDVYISVRETFLRSKPSFLSKGIVLRHGDALSVLDKDLGNWIKVKNVFGKTGYIHSSSVSERRIVLKTNNNLAPRHAAQSDVVMAGKGFSREVERQFALKNRALNFAAVDRMEREKISVNDLSNFIKQGKLSEVDK